MIIVNLVVGVLQSLPALIAAIRNSSTMSEDEKNAALNLLRARMKITHNDVMSEVFKL